MWPILAKLFSGGASTVIDSAGGVVKTIWGDQAAKDAALSSEQIAILNQYAAEFAVRPQRTLWDSFVDGLNRLIRPGLALGAQAAFVWAALDPVTFAECMRALGLVPEPLWFIWAGIFAFYFSGRIIENMPKKWKVEPAALNLAREIAGERRARREAETAASIGTPGPEAVVPLSRTAGTIDTSVPAEAWARPQVQSPADQVYSPPAKDNSSSAELALAATIWGEARGEPREGKIAVGCVIRNRVDDAGWWGRDWISVCTAEDQFTCWWDDQGRRVRTVDEGDPRFVECLEIARAVIMDVEPDPTGGATHYYADYVKQPPKWARGKVPTVKIGCHLFFKIGRGG